MPILHLSKQSAARFGLATSVAAPVRAGRHASASPRRCQRRLNNKGGQRVDGITHVWDVMPTTLELAGIQHPEKYRGREVARMRGKSLKGVLTGTTKTVYGEKEFICGEMGGRGGWARQGSFKAVWNAAPYGNGAWHLYNLAEDPGETRDLAKEHPEKLQELQAAWDRYAKDVGVVLSK